MFRRFAVALMAIALVASTAGFASATTPELIDQAASRMFALGLVKSVNPTHMDLALNANLTRAQLVTILVRAFGQDANAQFLNGAAAFTDTANHPWASGYIALAKRIIAERTNGKEVIGLPDGSFNPDGNVTAAQAVAFLMKFLGAPPDTAKAWPDNYLGGALKAGLITESDRALLAGIQNSPATRGLAFYLADRAFYTYQLPEGGTVYTHFVDPTAPTITLGKIPDAVQAQSVTISGQVSEPGTLTANGAAVALDAANRFSYTLPLANGQNTVIFVATDIAGNKSVPALAMITGQGIPGATAPGTGLTHPVTTPAGPAATYSMNVAVGTGRVPVTHSEPVTVTVTKLADGQTVVTPPYTVTVDPSLGTYDPQTNTFTAGRTPGAGKLVTEAAGNLRAETEVTVFNEFRVVISPNDRSANPGDTITFTAKLADYLGNEKPADPVEWSASAGTIDAAGSLTIPDMKGQLTVTATADGKTGTASVWVGIPKP
jgi:hypothetical protein